MTQLHELAKPFPQRVIQENPSGGGSYVPHHPKQCSTVRKMRRREWTPEIEGDVAYIPLTKGKKAVIDKDDLPIVLPRAWAAAQTGGRTWYATSHLPRSKDAHTPRMIYLHRVIMGFEPGDPYVDHINRDGLDCRKANLRASTMAENLANAPSRGGISQYKGVSRARWDKGWRAYIKVDGRQVTLGVYTDEKAAARAVDVAAVEAFGEFAWLNFRGES
jgi:hypothetical protein